MNVVPVAAEQLLGLGDQRIEMQFALLLGFVVGARSLRQTRGAGHHVGSGTDEFVAMGDRHLFGHLAHIIALVGVGRERHGLAVLVEVAQPGRQAEDVHLTAGIIDVVLAGHIPAGKGEQAGQRGAVGRTAAVADVQRAGRVGRDEFDLHLLLATGRRAAESRAFGQHGAHDIDLGPRIEGEIDEAGTGHFRLGNQHRNRQFRQQLVGNFARILLQRLGQLHGQVGRPVAVRRVTRALELDGSFSCGWGNAGQSLLQQGGQLGFDVVGH